MKFVLVLCGLVCGFFAVGRLLLPDPDGSLDATNKKEVEDFRSKALQGGIKGFVFLAFFPLVMAFFFPFYRPAAGILLAILLIVAGLII